jgi:hypothetical protein
MERVATTPPLFRGRHRVKYVQADPNTNLNPTRTHKKLLYAALQNSRRRHYRPAQPATMVRMSVESSVMCVDKLPIADSRRRSS